MAIDIATVLNGSVLSAKSCKFFFDNIPRHGVVAVNYKEEIEAEDVYDDDPTGLPVGSTSGRYKISGLSITLLKKAWIGTAPPGLALQLAARPEALGSFGAARWTFSAEYSEPQDPLNTILESIAFCRIVGVEDDYSEDIKTLVTKLDLKANFMTRQSGLTLFDPKRGLGL